MQNRHIFCCDNCSEFSSNALIFLPFLAIVKLFVSNVPDISKKIIVSPTCGEAGNVAVFT